jgi:hypothetical protein
MKRMTVGRSSRDLLLKKHRQQLRRVISVELSIAMMSLSSEGLMRLNLLKVVVSKSHKQTSIKLETHFLERIAY